MNEAVHTLTNDGGTETPLGTEKERPKRTLNQTPQERTPSRKRPQTTALTRKGMAGKREAPETLNGTHRELAWGRGTGLAQQ
jgi:hypothetical protein